MTNNKTSLPVTANDWEHLHDGLYYSPSKDLYFSRSLNQIRDHESASWAGWIGMGASLKRMIKSNNEERNATNV